MLMVLYLNDVTHISFSFLVHILILKQTVIKKNILILSQKNNIGMSHIIAHIFHTRNISSTRLPQDVCICTLFQFPTRKKEKKKKKRSKTSR